MEETLTSILGKECYTEFGVNHNFGNTACLSLLLSKWLGYSVIAGSVLLKVPQIVKILNAGSAKGISILMLILELTVFLISVSYSHRRGYAFSTFGEGVFISIQNVILLLLIYYYEKRSTLELFALLGVYGAVVYTFLVNPNNLVTMELLSFLQSINILIVIASRIPQIWSNFRTKATGQLAFLTFFLNFAGGLARVFTTLKETADVVVLVSFLISTALNGIIAVQILYYGEGKPAPAASSKKPEGKRVQKKRA